MMRPTAVEPVKLTLCTAGWRIILSVIVAADERGQQMKLSTPFGKPAFLKLSTSRYCVYGLDSDAFRTTVLPQISGVMKALIPRIYFNRQYRYTTWS